MIKNAIATILLFFTFSSIFGWSRHHYVSQNALIGLKEFMKEVEVETLDSFVKAEFKGLQKLFVDYRQYLLKYNHYDYENPQTQLEYPTEVSFLKAARLNQQMRLRYVKRVEDTSENRKKYKSLIMYKKKVSRTAGFHRGKPTAYLFVKTPKKIRIKDIFIAYCDEPDWGLDMDVWLYKYYDYGKAPLGKPSGPASAGLFHTLYTDENIVVKTFGGEVTRSRLPERVELYWRLHKLAAKTKHEYWSFRFAAMGLHYLQDITQPYHTTGLPELKFLTVLNYIFSFGIFGDSKQDIKRKNAIKLLNRHYLFEQFGAVELYKQNKMKNSLARFSDTIYPNFENPDLLVEYNASVSRRYIVDLDDAMLDSLPEELGDNGLKVLSITKGFIASEIFKTLPREKQEEIKDWILKLASNASIMTQVYAKKVYQNTY